MKKVLLYIGFILFIVLVIWITIIAQRFTGDSKVKNLVITNNKIIPSEVLLDFILLRNKEALESVTGEIIIDRIEKHPYIKSVNGYFVDSITFQVDIEEVIPFAMILTSNDQYVLTNDKKLIKYDNSLNLYNLPVVTCSFMKKFDKNDPNSQRFIESIYSSLDNIFKVDKGLYNIISELNLEREDKINLYLTEPRAKILVGDRIDLKKAIYLSEFWRQVILFDGATNYQYIDLRFKDQIVTKKIRNNS